MWTLIDTLLYVIQAQWDALHYIEQALSSKIIMHPRGQAYQLSSISFLTEENCANIISMHGLDQYGNIDTRLARKYVQHFLAYKEYWVNGIDPRFLPQYCQYLDITNLGC